MKKRALIAAVTLLLVLISCAPVLRKDLMERGSRDVPLARMKETPLAFEGKLFILGGLIVKTKNTHEGSLIEAVYVPVDSYGYLKNYNYAKGRYLALFPKASGFLDPEIYRRGKDVTIAGVFTGIRTAKLDEADYPYPTFEIKEIYLWEEQPAYPYAPYVSPYYGYGPGLYGPYWYDPFWGRPGYPFSPYGPGPYGPYWW